MSPEGLHSRLRERFSALRVELERLRFETDRRWEELLALRASEAPAAAALSRGAISLHAARRLDKASDQVEALARFLEECLRHASRAILLVDRGGEMHAWKSAGFARSREEERRVSPLPADPAISGARGGVPQRLPEGNEISVALGAGDAAEAVLIPFVVREKVSGAVYADVVADERSKFDPEAVALLTWLAGLAVDRLAKRKLVPSPALLPMEGPPPAPADAALPSFASVAPRQSPAAPLPRDESPESSPAAGAGGNGPLGGPLAPRKDDEIRDEARRFARLLASEIKLYNEGAVREGRERGNLYLRLREDIERGRRLYEERVPPDVRADEDYYYKELVDVLAGGRPEALGIR